MTALTTTAPLIYRLRRICCQNANVQAGDSNVHALSANKASLRGVGLESSSTGISLPATDDEAFRLISESYLLPPFTAVAEKASIRGLESSSTVDSFRHLK